ncbi:MAG: cytidine deaminase [Ancrocorticia sp.]
MTITSETWAQLHDHAVAAMRKAYVPYSGYPVGAAGLANDGTIYSGCNVENSSYGLGLCAECGMISDFIKNGGGRLLAVVAVNGNEDAVVPCGRCRQLIFEHGGKDALVAMPAGIMPMSEVLPDGFGPENLIQVPTATFKERTRD